ncbi:tumor necrosis factor alpha-induced protein 2 [Pyxicephalus adspersus]|uniref:tumor necrosis factor alpha-induced protein 2 n=1 Tax=Pyxicephalus adspersus TaxID=30357 RepID=UPI003B59A61B
MKKIKIKMAGVAPVPPSDKPVDGIIKEKKKKWYKQIAQKFFPPVWPEQSPENPVEEKKEITAEDIQRLIEEQEFHPASKGLVEMEHKMYNGLEETSTEDKELESLYEKLKSEVFQIIKESLTNTEKEPLQQAVQAIVVQESEDSKINPDLKNVSRPKGWMQAWKECVRQTVEERLNDLPQEEKKNGPPSIPSTLTALGKLFKNDLIHLVTHIKGCYPEEFDVCNTYAEHYHQNIKTRAENITQFELWEKDNYYVLWWTQNLYPNEILKNPILSGHIDDVQLGSLLPQHTIRNMENNYLSYEADSVKAHMNKALDLEVELWKQGKEPKILSSYYHSELHIDIIQCYASGFQRAAEIRPEMEDSLALLLAHELEEILRRYKKQFGEYIEKNKTQSFYRAICIAHLNCCLGFRKFLNRKESKLRENHRLDMSSLLQQLEDSVHDALLQDLFADLKNQFRKMSQGSSPFSHQIMKNIIATSEAFMDPFHTLMDESCKALSGKIHLYLVKEHLTRMMKRKVCCKSVQQMQTLANQISENAELIDSFSSFYRSCEDWLRPALPKLAEIIRLQDLNAIQLEVATLVTAYPDIRNKQIEAILSIKGNLSRNEVKSILKTADTIERRVNS